MIAFLAFLLVNTRPGIPSQGQVAPVSGDESPRTVIHLPNGSTLITEKVPGMKSLILNLDCADHSSPLETENGSRHLMEHIVALGKDGTLDVRLESVGAFLVARTFRDGIDISIASMPGDLETALSGVNEIVNSVPTEVDLAREEKIINQEIAIEPSPERLSGTAWQALYGTEGADPVGDPKLMAEVKLKELISLISQTFEASNVCLTVRDSNITDDEVDQLTKFLLSLKKSSLDQPLNVRAVVKLPAFASTDGFGVAHAKGEALAVPVPGLNQSDCAAAIALAFSIASLEPNLYVMYTPTVNNGVVLIGSDEAERVRKAFSDIDESQLQGLFSRGKSIAVRYVEKETDSSDPYSFWRGYLTCQNINGKPQVLENRVKTLTFSEFAKAWRLFHSAAVVHVVGEGN